MSRSYWLPAIAIGLVLSNAANAEGVSRDTRRDAARNQSGPIPIENIFPTSDFPGVNELQRIAHALEAQVADSQSPEEQDRAERGVEAAERLADWTPGILAVAFLEIVITGFGVFLLAGTLGHTRRTADAAEKTLAETTKNARLELRAYLSVEPAGINRLYGETAEALGHVMVTNVGKLPAKNVQVVVRLLASQDRAHFEFYNLESDPQEKTDLKAKEAGRFEAMRKSLEKLNAEIEKEGPDWWKRLSPNGGGPLKKKQ